MIEIKIDTNKVREIGEQLKKESLTINENIIKLFNLLEEIPKNNIWLGYSSNHFFNKVLPEKQYYLDFNRILDSYAKHLLNTAQTYENLAKKYGGKQ